MVRSLRKKNGRTSTVICITQYIVGHWTRATTEALSSTFWTNTKVGVDYPLLATFVSVALGVTRASHPSAP